MKKFILFILVSLFLIPIGVKADGIFGGYYDYGGKVVVTWVDAHNKLNMRPDEITIPLTGNLWDGGVTRPVKYDLVLNKNDAQITEDGVFTYWTFDNLSFPFDAANSGLKFEYDSSVDFNLPRGYKKGIDFFINGQLGCVTHGPCGEFEKNVLNITLIKDVSKDIPIKEVFNDDNGRDNYRYIYFYMKGKNTVDTYREFEGTVKLKVDEYSDVMELIQYLVTDVGSSNELEQIEYEYGILDSVYDLTDSSYQYTVEALDNGDIIYTINHKAERIKVPIKINWVDDNNLYGKRPNNLTINTINQYDEVEETVKLTDENWDTELELFKNIKYSFGTEQIEYSLDISNTKDYEYKVEKVDDGFVITANYIGEKIVPNDNENVDDNTETVIEEDNPHTYDNINVYVVMLLGGLSVAIGVKKIYLNN